MINLEGKTKPEIRRILLDIEARATRPMPVGAGQLVQQMDRVREDLATLAAVVRSTY